MTKVGDRVRLLQCTDQWTTIEPGTLGTVHLIDSQGTVFVKWDNGRTIGLIREAGDRWEDESGGDDG